MQNQVSDISKVPIHFAHREKYHIGSPRWPIELVVPRRGPSIVICPPDRPEPHISALETQLYL